MKRGVSAPVERNEQDNGRGGEDRDQQMNLGVEELECCGGVYPVVLCRVKWSRTEGGCSVPGAAGGRES